VTSNQLFDNDIGIEFNALCVRCIGAPFGNVIFGENRIFRNGVRGLFLGFGEVRRSQFTTLEPVAIRNNAVSANGTGITLFYLPEKAPVEIANNSIGYNRTGIELIAVQDEALRIRRNDIYNNTDWGARVAQADVSRSPDLVFRPTRANLEENYWNDPLGPWHEALNPRSKGDRLGARPDEINFLPALESPSGALNRAPTASLITPLSPASVNQEITFDARGSRDDRAIAEYFFDYGDGVTSGWVTTPVTTHKYTRPGSYRVRLLVRDDLGVPSSAPVAVAVLVGEPPPPAERTPTPTVTPSPTPTPRPTPTTTPSPTPRP
jgi:hypothetical protein